MIIQHQTPIYTRSCIAMLMASITTLALFYLMNTLIDNGDIEVLDDPPLRWVEFVRVHEPPAVDVKRPKAKKPADPEPDPAVPTVSIQSGQTEYGPTIDPAPAPGPTKFNPNALSDGSILPLVKVAPNYPRSARAKGIEGYVIVEFDVAADGSVRDPVVVENHPNGIFDTAAIKAVLKFRYRPRVDNGQPVMFIGVQNLFKFQLDDS